MYTGDGVVPHIPSADPHPPEAGIHSASLIALLLTATLTTGCTSFRDCSTVDASAAEALPELLSQTGLYADIEGHVVSGDVLEFEPRFPLWTDGAKKRRWILLPEGAQVDTSSSEDWVFPVGTKFFKEFSRDGVRIETRMNTRTEDGWTGVAYLWNEAGDEAERLIEGGLDVSGTTHDVPSAAECLACHAGRANFSLGFSATQLDLQVRTELHDAGLLSDRVQTDIDLPPEVREGLGVLHGNCSHCHNATRDDQPLATTCYAPAPDDSFDLTLPSDLSDLEDAPALLTARWQLGDLDDSEVLMRMSHRNLAENNPSMPPLGTEIVDDEGVAAVEAFLAELPPRGR